MYFFCKGLGVNESGITEALKPKLKFDTSGIGHDAAEQFTYHWWENAYNQAAENLEVCRNEDGVAVKVNDDSFDISTRKYLVKSSRTGSALLYGNFLKTSTLTGDGHIVQECGEELSQSIKLVSAVTLTDEELLKACGGLTAHKGARHGLTLSGKLSRIQEQERKLLDSMNNKENAVEYVTVEDLCNGKEKKKKNKKKRVNEESAGIEDLATFETIEPQGKKKKKNKNKEVSELLESNLASCENNENVSNVDESAGFEDLATAGSIEPQRKKKKKNKNKEVGELSESNIASCENNEDVSNVDESAKIEDLTTVGSTQHKKKKKKKNKEVSVNDENKNTEASYVQENGRKKKYEDPNESADQTLSADVDELTVKSRKKKKDAHSHVLNGKLEENCVDTSSVSYCIPEEMGDTKRKCKKKEDLSTEMENETRTSGDALTNIDYPSHTTKTRPPLTWRETPEGWLCCHCAAGEDANLNNSLSNGDAHAPQKKKKKKKHKEKKDNGDNISSPSVERNTVDQPDSILYDTSTFDEHNSQNKKHHKGRRLNSEQLPQSQDKQEVEGDGEQENGECFPDATLEHSAEGSALLGNTSEVTDSSSKKKKWKEKHLENGDEANDVLENISGVSKKGKKKKKRESENPEQESTVPQKKVKVTLLAE